MPDKSAIEWTDATWNPSTGCTPISAGCDHCYAKTVAEGKLREVYGRKLPVVDTEGNRADPFAFRLWPDRLTQPERWKDPRLIFVNSMSDLFHVDMPDHFLRECFAVMLQVDHHIYQVLTKRPGRAIRFFERNADLLEPYGGRLPWWVWIGASVEDQAAAFRVGQLLRIPAEVRFLSCEPMLGPVTLFAWLAEPAPAWFDGNADQPQQAQFRLRSNPGLHWVICGGESGHHHRPLDLNHARQLRDQCNAAGVPFLFKQVGGHTPKKGGRELDGRTWDEYPTHPEVQRWMAARAEATHG